MPVTVNESQASKFKDNYKTETQVIEELLNSQVPAADAMKGIKNVVEIGATGAKFNYDVDTSVLGSKDYDATVSFSDGSSTVVPITVKVVSLADKFDDSADLTAVTRKIGETVKSTDAIEGVVDASKNGVQSAVFNEDVPTNEQGSTPYDATLTFIDGSKKDVKITVNVGANEASTFNKAQLIPLVKIPVGTKIDSVDTTNAQAALKDPSQIGKTITGIQYVNVLDTSKPRNILKHQLRLPLKIVQLRHLNKLFKLLLRLITTLVLRKILIFSTIQPLIQKILIMQRVQLRIQITRLIIFSLSIQRTLILQLLVSKRLQQQSPSRMAQLRPSVFQ